MSNCDSVLNEQAKLEDSAPAGALEQFIGEFHAFETDSELFLACVDRSGFRWWDLVRYNIQYSLCVERNIYAGQVDIRSPRLTKMVSRASQFFALVIDLVWFAVINRRSFEHVHVYRRRPGPLIDCVIENAQPSLVICDQGTFPSPHACIRRQSVELLVRALSLLVRVPEDVRAASLRIDDGARLQFQTELNINAIILKKYKRHIASKFIWTYILGRLGRLKMVGFVNDDSLKTLVFLANRRGIATREYQHGYIGSSHLNYSYPPLGAPVPTLPAEIWVNHDTGDITYPVRIVRQERKLDNYGTGISRDIDVLVGGSPTRVADTLSILKELLGEGLSVAIKLHPSQTTESLSLTDHVTGHQFQIFAGETDFATTVRRSRVYIPANQTSTTAFEAVENGAKLIVVDYDGTKLASMIDGIVSARVNSLSALSDAVHAALAGAGDLSEMPSEDRPSGRLSP